MELGESQSLQAFWWLDKNISTHHAAADFCVVNTLQILRRFSINKEPGTVDIHHIQISFN